MNQRSAYELLSLVIWCFKCDYDWNTTVFHTIRLDSLKSSDHFDVLCVLIACMVLEIINQMSTKIQSYSVEHCTCDCHTFLYQPMLVECVLCDLICHLLSPCRTISVCSLNHKDGEGFCKALWEEGHAYINAWPGCSRQNKYPSSSI